MEKTETGDYLAQDVFHIESDLYRVELSRKELKWTVAEGQESKSTDAAEKLSLFTREILSVELLVQEIGKTEVSTDGRKPLQIFLRKKQPPSSGILTINYAKKKNLKSEEWKIKKLKLTHADFSILEKWFSQLQFILKDFRRPRNILVFVNPYGGSRDAPKIFENQVKPVFEISNVSWTLIQTERQCHATDTLLSMSAGELSTYDVALGVGGDGTICEIVTGLLKRGQEDSKKNHLSDSNSNVETLSSSSSTLHHSRFGPAPMKIAVISAGSTNSLAFTLHGTEDATTAAIHLVLGGSVPLDVASIDPLSSSTSWSSSNGNGKNSNSNNDESDNFRLIVGQMSYGHLADTLKYSEKLRWMGPKRYDYAGFKKFLEHNAYHGRIHMKLAEETPSTPTLCDSGNGCDFCKNSKKEEPSSTKWTTVEGQFLGISGANMSCRCTISKRGLAPYAHLSDGCLDLMLIKRASHLDHLKYLLRLAGDSRRVMDLPFIERYRVYEFKFEPITCSCANSNSNSLSSTVEKSENSSEKSCLTLAENLPECSCDAASRLKRQSGWNCDGELLTSPSIHVKVHQNLIKIMSKLNSS